MTGFLLVATSLTALAAALSGWWPWMAAAAVLATCAVASWWRGIIRAANGMGGYARFDHDLYGNDDDDDMEALIRALREDRDRKDQP